MRTIKFRGQRTDNGDWVYGYLVLLKGVFYIVVDNEAIVDMSSEGKLFSLIMVKPETVGEFTGLTDKKENEIYEDDIIHLKFDTYDKDFGIVKWHKNGYFYIDDNFGKFPKDTALPIGDFFNHIKKDFEGIEVSINGNIHDNPELIKKGE